MPINDFQGDAFVAFADIGGFKAMMADGNRAAVALDVLYRAGYDVANQQQHGPANVEGLFVSDSGILFARGNGVSEIDELSSLLRAVARLNWRCFRKAVSLTTSIAFGEFSYHQRIEVPGVEKNPVYGNAYVNAFLDNEAGTPRLYTNECRIVKEGLTDGVLEWCQEDYGELQGCLRETENHFYFEWMRLHIDQAV